MKIWIKNNVVTQIFLDANKWLPKETGGILMGYIVENEYVIIDFIGPGERAIHDYNSFEPDQSFHESEIANKYNDTKQKITYLGDWHTHPNSFPYLSNTDKKTAHKISKYKKARLPSPLMLVAAPPSSDFKVWVYEGEKSSKSEYVEGEIIIF